MANVSRFNLPTDLNVSGNIGATITGSVYVKNSVSASQFSGSGVGITDLTGTNANFKNFTSDVRDQFVSGTGINYSQSTGRFDLNTQLTGGATSVEGSDRFNIVIQSGTTPYPTASLAADIYVTTLSASHISGSGDGLSNIPAKAIVGLNLAQIATGSVTASVSETTTEAFKVVSGSTTLFNLDNAGLITAATASAANTVVTGTATDNSGYNIVFANPTDGQYKELKSTNDAEKLSYNPSSNLLKVTASYASNAGQLGGIAAAQYALLTASNVFTETNTFQKDLVVQGQITAREFVVQTVTSSILYESGSTKFGNDVGDTHEITGSLRISGSLFTYNGNTGGTAPDTENIGQTGALQGDVRILKNLEVAGGIVNNPNAVDAVKTILVGSTSDFEVFKYPIKYFASKLVISAETDNGGDNQISEALIVRNNAKDALKITPYGVVYTSTDPLVSFDAEFSGSGNTHVALKATNNTVNDIRITVQAIYMQSGE
jgi:hypothetical protein